MDLMHKCTMKESVYKEKGICCVSGPQTRSQAAHIENNPLGLVCVCVFWHLWQSYKTKQGNYCSATNTNMLSSNRVGAFDKRRIGDILSIQLHKEKSLWHIFLSLKWISRMLTHRAAFILPDSDSEVSDLSLMSPWSWEAVLVSLV